MPHKLRPKIWAFYLQDVQITTKQELVNYLDTLRQETPFIVPFGPVEGEAEVPTLEFGIGGDYMCIQHVSADQNTYLMAKKDCGIDPRISVKFDLGGNLSEFRAPFLLPFKVGVQIIVYFFESTELSPDVEWE